MQKFYGKMKGLLLTISVASIVAALGFSVAKADSVDQPYLQNIQTYTNSILATVNTIPAYLTLLGALATTWMASDNGSSQPVDWSTNWSNEQNWLASLSTSALTNEANQYTMQQTLLTSFFGANNIATPSPANLNDLSYTTLLGQPLVSPDPRTGVNSAMNYLTNASGLGLPLTMPSSGFRGDATSQKNYTNFYNTVTAVQTYNGFVLSRLYQDSQSEQSDSSLRKQLITQSSNSSWFTSVITNDLGWVLRQILLYSSQTYVLMDQLVQTQKQMAATLAMTNTLFIVSNELQGNFLLKQAQG
jgi:hypothetical protein